MKIKKLPKVAVLLTAFNGEKFIEKQINSIVLQKNIDLTLYVSVDKSTDNTDTILDFITKKNKNIIKLDHKEIFGKASINFFYLIKKLNLNQYDYISFSDQDDFWFDFKLERSISYILEHKADAYSSNVFSQAINSKYKKKIIKNHRQVKFDFLFESAGPGCTYVLKRNFFLELQSFIKTNWNLIQPINHWDWLVYAYARSKEKKWEIDEQSTMIYVQHANNDIGANVSLKGLIKRLKMLFSKYWFKQSVLIITALGIKNEPFCREFIDLNKRSFLHLAKNARHCRRKLFDKFVFFNVCVLISIFL